MGTRKQPRSEDETSGPGSDGPSAATFMLLPEDRSRVEDLRKRAAALGRVLNKSEAVRLALLGSRAIKDADLSSALEELPRLRPGRHS